MLKAAGMWDVKRGVYCPLMDWTDKQVLCYLRLRHIQLPAEYQYMKSSFGGSYGEELKAIKQHFPADYRKILDVFPHCEALVCSYELFREGKLKRKPRGKTVEKINSFGSNSTSPSDHAQRLGESSGRSSTASRTHHAVSCS